MSSDKYWRTGRRSTSLHAALVVLLATCSLGHCRLLLQVDDPSSGSWLGPLAPSPSPAAPSPSPCIIGAYTGLCVQESPSPAVDGGSPAPAQPSPSPSPQPVSPNPTSPSTDQSSPSPSPSTQPSPNNEAGPANTSTPAPTVVTPVPSDATSSSPAPVQSSSSPPSSPQPPTPPAQGDKAVPVTTDPAAPAAVVAPTTSSPNSGSNGSSGSSGSSGSGGGLSTGALVGIIVGAAGAAILAAAVCATILVRRRRKRERKLQAIPSKDEPGAPVQVLPSAFGSDIRPLDDGRGPSQGPGPGGSFVFGSGVASAPFLPASATVPVPPGLAHKDPAARWSSGPAALADQEALLHGSPRGPATPAPAATAAAGYAAGLEGWLAHSRAAATPDPSYPPIDPLLQRDLACLAPTAQQATGSPRVPAMQPGPSHAPWLTPVIPEDTPLAVDVSNDGSNAQPGAWGPPRAGSARHSSEDEAGRLSWEQMVQERSQIGAPSAGSAAATPAPATAPGLGVKQQRALGSDDTAPVADIGASPFAHLLGGAAAALGGSSIASALVSRGASGPLSPVTPAAGTAAAAAGHPLAIPGIRATNAAAAPAGATAARIAPGSGARGSDAVSMSASPFAAMFGGASADESTRVGSHGRQGASGSAISTSASPFATGLPVIAQSKGASAVSTSASPFASGLPAFGDDSLSSAIIAASANAAAAAAAAGGAGKGGTPGGDQGWPGASPGSSTSGLSGGKQGYTPRSRYSSDTSSSAVDRSWQSNASSMAAAAAAHTAQLPSPSAAPQARPQARQPSEGALVMQASVAPKATRYMSGPRMDPHWDFGQSGAKPVRVMLQVNMEDTDQPVSVILMVSAPPPRPEVLAQIVLPLDPPQAGVDLAIDANRDLAFPSNSFLGAGAFGQVHRALYRGVHPVAVKMLTDPGIRNPDEDTLRSFREELSIMAKLQHPHILRCYGGNLEGNNPFIVTELCECSLDKMILYYRKHHGTGLPLRHTLTIGLHIAAALWHLHPSVVHRDLKPQNVLLDIHGTAKVADFGLSRIKTHTYLSTTHLAAGTASYMAPECFAGGHVGEKADVYSLGCMLWECVTGERPWRGLNVVQVAYQVAMAKNRPPLPPVDPDSCPHELVTLLEDCFSFNPRERPSSGEVMKLMAHMMRTHLPEIS